MKNIIILFFVVLIATGGGVVVYQKVRGIRNNNPGNIRHGDNWQGMSQEQTDPAFAQFEAPEYGIRAMVKILLRYHDAYGLNTVRGIVHRWAPPVENDSESYAQHVAAALAVAPDQPIDVRAVMAPLVAAIIKHENGVQPYDLTTINRGLQLAGLPAAGAMA